MKIFSDTKQINEIKTLDEWFKYCPPKKKEKQWQPKKSAQEMARFWLNVNNQLEFQNYLQKFLLDINLNFAYPEFSTKFDEYRSPRENDLCIFSNTTNENVLITIEGKANEHYGNSYFNDEWIKSIIYNRENPESHKLERIVELYKRYSANSDILKLRYQLVYWLAGTIEEAKRNKTDSLILISQEFHSDITIQKDILLNQSDFNEFIRFISEGEYNQINTHELIGPIENKLTDGMKVYYGRFIVDLK